MDAAAPVLPKLLSVRVLWVVLGVGITVVAVSSRLTVGPGTAGLIDLSSACVLHTNLDRASLHIPDWIVDELNSRTVSPGAWQHSGPDGCDSVRVELRIWAQASRRSGSLSPSANFPVRPGCCPTAHYNPAPGSFRLAIEPGAGLSNQLQPDRAQVMVSLAAADPAGLQSGAGRLLRELRMPARGEGGSTSLEPRSKVQVPGTLCVCHDSARERWHVRGHQIAVDHHPLQFRSRPAFAQFARDLAVFGTNTLEMAHLRPLGNTGTIDGMIDFSEVCAELGLNVSVWGSVVAIAGNQTEMLAAFHRIPRLDSVFFPGGDGGVLDWAAIQSAAVKLDVAHPGAGVWVSAQELSAAGMQAFWRNVSAASSVGWLAGVVYGPHVRAPLTEFVQAANEAGSRAVRQYPDITHTLSDQFPLPSWHPAWSLTHGRQTTCPLPSWSASIVRLRSNGSTPTTGVGAYSEGLGDDLNKAIWSAMAEDPSLAVADVIAQYARYFFGASRESDWVEALAGLELNWRAPPRASNHAIATTLAALRRATAGVNLKTTANWRAAMYLKRGCYDAYIQARYTHEVEGNEAGAWRALATATAVGSKEAILAAKAALSQNMTKHAMDAAATLRAEVLELTAILNQTVGAEVLGNQDPGLNVERIDVPVSEAPFLLAALSDVESRQTEQLRLDAIAQLLNHTNPGPGGFYDYLGAGIQVGPGSINRAPHLRPGQGPKADPSFFFTPSMVVPTRRPADPAVRLSWSSFSMSFFDSRSIALEYPVNPALRYEAWIVFNADPEPVSSGGGEGSGCRGRRCRLVDDLLPNPGGNPNQMQLLADGVVVWPRPPDEYGYAPFPMIKTVVPIPAGATADGTLVLSCAQPPGIAGNGRTCEIVEVWLVVIP